MQAVISYNGPIYIAIWSGKHGKSFTASSSWGFLKTFEVLIVRVSKSFNAEPYSSSKLVYVNKSDAFFCLFFQSWRIKSSCRGAKIPKWNLDFRFCGWWSRWRPKNQQSLASWAKVFFKYNLDALFVFMHATGMILLFDTYGTHLNESNETTDIDLETKNLKSWDVSWYFSKMGQKYGKNDWYHMWTLPYRYHTLIDGGLFSRLKAVYHSAKKSEQAKNSAKIFLGACTV